MEYLSFRWLGIILLFNLGNYGLCANLCQTLIGQPLIIQEEFVSSLTSMRWRKNGRDLVVVSVPPDGSQPNCTTVPATPPAGYTPYCYNDTNYEIEVHKPEDHIGSRFETAPEGKYFKDNDCVIEIIDPGSVQCSSNSITINNTSVELICGVYNTNIDNVNFTVKYDVLEKTFSVPDNGLNNESGNSLYNITTKYEISKDSPGFEDIKETTTIKAFFIVDYGITIDNSTEITIEYTIDIGTSSSTPDTTLNTQSTTTKLPIPSNAECCRCHYNLIVLIIKAALIVLVIIVVIIHFCRREAKKCGTVYWALNILLIIGGLGCVILAIVQIVYLTDESDDSCQDTCQEEAGCDAAIAFVVLGFITAVLLNIVVLILRLKNRDQKKETEMKPGSEKEKKRNF